MQTKMVLFGRTVYLRNSNGNWAVIIMPDKIIIDNYHNREPHIHNEPEKHHIYLETKLKDPVKIYEVVQNHLNRNEGLKKDELIKELIK